MTRIYLIANHKKPQVREALKHFRPWLSERANVICDIDSYAVESTADFDEPADMALVLGGDGTLLSIGRIMVDLDIPIIGVNFGKLGFLAPFNLEELKNQWDNIVHGENPTSNRVMLHAIINTKNNGQEQTFSAIGANDVVITAGEPFRMIDLELIINTHEGNAVGTHFNGDGVIISTPTGSTAYNVSAGGPILAPDVNALVVTPICPHSLSFRPLVVNGDDQITLNLHETNKGTTLVIDGQVSQPIHAGAKLTVKRYHKTLKLIVNPQMNYWNTLITKMKWAADVRN